MKSVLVDRAVSCEPQRYNWAFANALARARSLCKEV